MPTFNENKKCQICQNPIPDDYVNLLCIPCYDKQTSEQELKKKQEEEDRIAQAKKNPESAINPNQVQTRQAVQGILDPNYQTNPEADDKDQILANLAQFIYSHDPKRGRKGKLLWYPQRNMYNFIKNYCMKRVMAHPQYPKHIWKPSIVDVGCGSGVGSNIMSQEADFVWGIDKNEWSIEFAKEAFERQKNGIYYSGQLTFDVFDIMKDTRDTMKFDIVTAIEVIEHIEDAEGFLRNIITKFTKRDKKGNCHIPAEATEFFISSPNRNFKKIRKDKPANIFHVREYTAQEFVTLLRQYFEEVILMNQKGESIPEDSSADEVIFAKCIYPKA